MIISAKKALRFGGLVILGLIIAAIAGCSNDRNPSSLPSTHPAAWMEISSQDFHGKVVLTNGTQSCIKCHGSDFNGGLVNVSCIYCHQNSTDMCVHCHGGYNANDKSGAPPYGLRGEISDSTLAVGAHTIHLHGSWMAGGMPCNSCHHVPIFVSDSAHLDYAPNDAHPHTDSIAEITWGGISDLSGGASWSRSDSSCAATYCHGNFAGGKSGNKPNWTKKNQANCGSCHDFGADPAQLLWKHYFHVAAASLNCADCHAATVDTFLNFIDSSLHVNGVPDTLTRDVSICNKCHGQGANQCVYCHGGVDNQTGAPPKGLRGEIATTTLAVGTHTVHLEGRVISDGIPCASCHIVPATVTSPGHYDVDSVAEITWGGFSNLNGGAAWDRNSAACASTYCHGNFSGGISTTPHWDTNEQATCGSCHDIGSNPAALLGRHQQHVTEESIACYQCHAATVNSSNAITGPGAHIDGVFTVSFWNGQGSYNNTTHQCSGPGGCHGSENWYSGGD
ncbi:hypothetical protein TRIP_C90378 [Candidatus Zixiibacteriota bacterium]|nr:hypothetical protein TRIP_C90378 [candidate division Zixibacteria bacterium]